LSSPARITRSSDLWSSGKVSWFVLIGIGVWLHAADSLVTATIAPSIVEDLGGITYVNWTISLYQIGAIVAGAGAAVLCLRFGIKRVFIGATLIYAIGCLFGGAANSMALLLAGRLVQGVGGGMLLSICYVAVEAWFDPALWARLFGFVAAIWGGGSLLGPLVGASFASPHAWRGAFWAFAIQAVVVAAFAWRIMPATESLSHPPERWPVLPLVALAAATLIIAEAGALSGLEGGIAISLLGCLAGAALLYVAARLDRRGPVRLLPRELLDRGHPVGAGLMMVFALTTASTGFWAYGPLILKILFNTQPIVTGYILAGESIAWSLGTMAASTAKPDHDRWLIRCGALSIAVGAGGFAIAVPTGSLMGMVTCALVQGAGFGLCWPAVVQRIVRFAQTSERSLASASVSTIQRIGYAVGTAAVGIAANLCGLAEDATADVAKTAGIWVFAAFIPILLLGLGFAWRFTAPQPPAGRADLKPPSPPGTNSRRGSAV